MNRAAPLLSIVAHARSGALDHAWRLFREQGFEQINDDAAVLNVRGRLLKDRALEVDGEMRQHFYLEAADAYARAGGIDNATYPLINAATLSLLAGQREQSQALARTVLERTLRREDEPETPYYRAATRAEALLLLGDVEQAKSDLEQAIELAPQAWEDHASTLRQFGLILDALGEDKAWLDERLPPRSLHFAGHITLTGDADTLTSRIREAIAAERIGFGFGALAAGADILIAEALQEAGAELHVVLPAPLKLFRTASVAAYGDSWTIRFDRIVATADSIRCIAGTTDPRSPLAFQLAAEIAMGRAAMQANVLMTEAVQLLIFDRNTQASVMAGGSQWSGEVWKNSGRRQRVIAAPRVVAAEQPVTTNPLRTVLAALLHIDFPDSADDSAKVLDLLSRKLAQETIPLIPGRWTGEAVQLAFESTTAASRAALAAAAVSNSGPRLRIAGHFGIVRQADDPFGGRPYLFGAAMRTPKEIVTSTPPGAIHVTEDFAASLHMHPAEGRPRTEYVGELSNDEIDNPVKLFSIKP